MYDPHCARKTRDPRRRTRAARAESTLRVRGFSNSGSKRRACRRARSRLQDHRDRFLRRVFPHRPGDVRDAPLCRRLFVGPGRRGPRAPGRLSRDAPRFRSRVDARGETVRHGRGVYRDRRDRRYPDRAHARASVHGRRLGGASFSFVSTISSNRSPRGGRRTSPAGTASSPTTSSRGSTRDSPSSSSRWCSPGSASSRKRSVLREALNPWIEDTTSNCCS